MELAMLIAIKSEEKNASSGTFDLPQWSQGYVYV